jgi:6-hydroxymethylpterin diphosphokinase MptE-like
VSDLAAAHLASNIDALGIGGLSAVKLREATPRGRYLILPNGTPALELDGRLLDAPVPHRETEAMVAQIAHATSDVAVVLGLGVGHVARTMKDRTRTSVVVYEPDPGLLRTVLEAGPLDVGGAPIVCDLSDLKAAWARNARARPSAITVQTGGYREAFPEACDAIAKTLQDMLADEMCVENTRRVRFRQWVDNILENVPLVAGCAPATALTGRFRGVPAFIVGAGPSLDKNVEELREASRRGLVIAVNSSANALAARGIVPHLVVCIESLDLSLKLGTIPWLDQVTRAFSLTSHPANLRTGTGPLLPLVENLPAFERVHALLGGPGAEVGGSVSTVAFWLAKTLGCSPLVLVGQDMAFTGNAAYASGTTYEGSRARLSQDGAMLEFDWNDAAKKAHGHAAGPLLERAPLVMVDAWGGDGLVPSGVMFSSFRVWFEVAAAVFAVAHPDLELVNATEGGARVRGFDEETLHDLVARLPVLGITPADFAASAAPEGARIPEKRVREWALDQALLARRAGRAARRVQFCAEEALRRAEQGTPGEVRRAFGVLSKAESFLGRACKAQPLVEGLAYAEVQTRMEPARHADPGDAREEATRGLRDEAVVAAALERGASHLERLFRSISSKHERTQ